MAAMQLMNIANRQRAYLVRDILFVALVALILALQISAFSSARPSAIFGVTGTGTLVNQSSNTHQNPQQDREATAAECMDLLIC